MLNHTVQIALGGKGSEGGHKTSVPLFLEFLFFEYVLDSFSYAKPPRKPAK